MRALLRTSFVALLAWGLLGTVLLLLLTPWLVSSVLKIPLWLRAESIRTFYLLAFVIPFVALTASFRGVLEAYHRFDLVNSVRIPLGFITFFGPLLVLRFTADLFQVTAALVFVRALTLIIHGFQLHRIVSRVPGERTAWCDLRSLLAYGGWITISNIISPILASADRFLIGALVSVSAVAYYALPFEIATKLLILAGGLVGVLFPAFSATVMKDRQRTAKICLRGMLFLFVAMFPVVLIVIALAREGLALWLGREFADNSFRALQCLTAGVFINSFAQIASALVQSAGRPDLTAKAHLAELPLYLACLWLLITIFGVPGAALAWFLRVLADGVLVFLFASRLVPSMTQHVRKIFFLVFATIIAALAIAQMHPLPLKVISLAAALFLTGLAVWTRLVPGGDKARLREAFREVLHRIHQKSAVFGKQENE